MKTFLATDALQFVDETAVVVQETVDVVVAIEGIREGAQFNTWAEFNRKYSEFAGGVSLPHRRAIEKYLSRIGLYFVEDGDTKVIAKVQDEVGAMLYDFYLSYDEPAISRITNIWQGENREKINKFLREKPWEKVEGRLRYSDYGFSNGVASALFSAMPETRLFEITEADFEIKLPEGSLWTIDKAYKVVGMTSPKRVDISCVCGKKMKMYQVWALENGRLSCISCGKRTTDFDAFYQSVADEGYKIVKDFQDTRPTGMSRIILQCTDKTHQPYSTYQNNWMSGGRRCPACSMRHVGEQKTREFLRSKGIPYEYRVCFDGLLGLGNGQLSYDFMIELNGENILLEIDGIGHFAPTPYGGRDMDTSEQAYLQQIEHDRRKDDFAVQNGFRLVRIQNINSDYDFILNSLEAILNGSTTNHYGSLYQKEG